MQKGPGSRPAVPGLLVFAHLLEVALVLCTGWGADALAHPSLPEKDGSWKHCIAFICSWLTKTQPAQLIFIIIINVRLILCYKTAADQLFQ